MSFIKMENCLMGWHETLASYGDQIKLNLSFNSNKFVDWTEEHFKYVRYNPRKDINRWGLSITSLDGGVTGIPDLDSLKEYNKENGTTYNERDFNVPTLVLENEELKRVTDPWKDDLFRSHVLKLGPGGFFPPHRDVMSVRPDSFRIISPLKNKHGVFFIMDNRILEWTVGSLYYLNTAKSHTLFNASMSPSYWLVLNVSLNENTVTNAIRNFTES
jgi:hypothetical protein